VGWASRKILASKITPATFASNFHFFMLRHLTYGKRDFRKGPVPPNTRFNWEFYAITSGKAAPHFRGKQVEEAGRTLWLLPPHTTYGWRGSNCMRYAFHFGIVPEELRKTIGTKPYLKASIDDSDIKVITKLASTLEEHFRKPHQLSLLHYQHALLTLSLILLKDEAKKKALPLDIHAEECIEKAIAWYQIHMTQNPTVEMVAEALHMSSMHLRRMSQKAQNRSPHKIFRELQIKRAMELLSNTSDTLEEIGRACGFQDVTSFAHIFQKEIGVSAHRWRTVRGKNKSTGRRDIRKTSALR
jgi:AraC family transcriptional regulator